MAMPGLSSIVRFHRISLALALFGVVVLGGAANLSAMPAPGGVEITPLTIDDAELRFRPVGAGATGANDTCRNTRLRPQRPPSPTQAATSRSATSRR